MLTGNFHPLRRLVTVEAMRRVQRSVFMINDTSSVAQTGYAKVVDSRSRNNSASGAGLDRGKYSGIGVFVSPTRAITADQNLGDAAVGSKLDIYIIEQGIKKQMSVLVRNSRLNYAVLGYDCQHSDYLQLYDGDVAPLVGESMGLWAYHLGILEAEELPKFEGNVAVMQADVQKVSNGNHYLIYRTDAWPGETGAAIIMHCGKLVGLHMASVRSFLERCDHHQEGCPESMVEDISLEQAARSAGSGFIALLANALAGDLLNTKAGQAGCA